MVAKKTLVGIGRWTLGGPIRVSLIIVLIFGTLLVLYSSSKGFYDDPSGTTDWLSGVLSEAHGVLLDIILIGVLATFLNIRWEKQREIARYQEEISDFQSWRTDGGAIAEEAFVRIKGNAKRLQDLKRGDCIRLSGFYLDDHDFSCVDLSSASISQAKLSGAKLHDAVLDRVDATGVVLYAANLRCASLREATLEAADLYGADLHKVDFEQADLRESDLRGAVNLACKDLGNAKSLYCTQVDNEQQLREELGPSSTYLFKPPTIKLDMLVRERNSSDDTPRTTIGMYIAKLRRLHNTSKRVSNARSDQEVAVGWLRSIVPGTPDRLHVEFRGGRREREEIIKSMEASGWEVTNVLLKDVEFPAAPA